MNNQTAPSNVNKGNAGNATSDSLHGQLIDDAQLTIAELADACAVEPTWIVEHVEDGLLEYASVEVVSTKTEWRFASRHLVRAKKLISFERDFDANPEVAALLVDLLEEIATLKRQLSN